VLPEFEAVTLRVAKRRDSIRHMGIRLAKLGHSPSALFDQSLHFLDVIDLEAEPRMRQWRFFQVAR
jgi:hypothetical protein